MIPQSRPRYVSDVSTLADGVRLFVRHSKRTPDDWDGDTIDAGTHGQTFLPQVNGIIGRGIKGGEYIENFDDLVERIGFINESDVSKYPEISKRMKARDLFNLVAHKMRNRKATLPSVENDEDIRNEKVGQHYSAAQLSIALQKAKVTEWDIFLEEFAKERKTTFRKTDTSLDTPVPTCLNDFLVATGFADRDKHTYDLIQRPARDLPAPLPKVA